MMQIHETHERLIATRPGDQDDGARLARIEQRLEAMTARLDELIALVRQALEDREAELFEAGA